MNMINKSLLIFALLITFLNFGCSQNDTHEQQIIKMLREFYIDRSNIKSNLNDLGKMNSLQKKYCSRRFQSKLQNQFQISGLDHDLLTNDFGIDSLAIKTLSIQKGPQNNDNFIVSYTILDDIVPNISKKEIKVILNITIIKEDGIFKVEDVN